ncbi:MAG: 50S ribosomal protein L6 [Candidatus Nanohaloarchaea archaeon]|nr:50S ribosomal protein L6 [Candidatus Nanohaloarchaea archaeon]
MEEKVEVPEEVEVGRENGLVSVASDDEKVEKTLDHPDVDIDVEDGSVSISTDSDRRDVEAIVGTYASHIGNMIQGVNRGFEYHMQGFYAHFPMEMQVQGDRFVISNFIGERSNREIDIPDGVSVEVDGEDVIVRGADKEKVGQTAANIEQACYKGDKDPRKFQDGIYLTERGVADE